MHRRFMFMEKMTHLGLLNVTPNDSERIIDKSS